MQDNNRMKSFTEFLKEQSELGDGGLTIFDIDETLFHTTALIAVVKNGKTIKRLSNSEFNTYKLGPGEQFDFSEFRSSEKFTESKPISRMLDKAKAIVQNVSRTALSKVIILTARANFDDKEKFLNVFRKHGLDMDKVRVERAGNITADYDVAAKKYIIIYNYLNTKQFSRVRLFDDSMANLKLFLKLKSVFPTVRFEAYYANPDGSIKAIK
jgi:thymidine kinase